MKELNRVDGGKYKLIDKEGYFGCDAANQGIYEKFFVGSTIIITEWSEGDLDYGFGYHDTNEILGYDEHKFFEYVGMV